MVVAYVLGMGVCVICVHRCMGGKGGYVNGCGCVIGKRGYTNGCGYLVLENSKEVTSMDVVVCIGQGGDMNGCG